MSPFLVCTVAAGALLCGPGAFAGGDHRLSRRSVPRCPLHWRELASRGDLGEASLGRRRGTGAGRRDRRGADVGERRRRRARQLGGAGCRRPDRENGVRAERVEARQDAALVVEAGGDGPVPVRRRTAAGQHENRGGDEHRRDGAAGRGEAGRSIRSHGVSSTANECCSQDQPGVRPALPRRGGLGGFCFPLGRGRGRPQERLMCSCRARPAPLPAREADRDAIED
jgi:hypothetical protein